MRLIDTVGYVILKKFSFTPDDEQISFFIKPYLNVWWSIPLDDFSAQEIESSIEQTNLQNQKIRDVFLQKDIIPKLLYK